MPLNSKAIIIILLLKNLHLMMFYFLLDWYRGMFRGDLLGEKNKFEF